MRKDFLLLSAQVISFWLLSKHFQRQAILSAVAVEYANFTSAEG